MDTTRYMNANETKIKADVEIEKGKDYEWFIEKVTEEDVSAQGQKPDIKPTLWFKETDKCFPLNKTNCKMIAQNFGSNETDDWLGRKVVLYRDMTSSPQGMVPCIRIREKGQAATLQDGDDIPF